MQKTDIFSCKFSVNVSLMLDNPFLVPSLCKLNHISLCFIQISTKSPAKLLIPFRESTVFWSHPRCFGPLSKFQHNIKISVKTACVFRLSVSCDYAFMDMVSTYSPVPNCREIRFHFRTNFQTHFTLSFSTFTSVWLEKALLSF